jgi:hypothetical protein
VHHFDWREHAAQNQFPTHTAWLQFADGQYRSRRALEFVPGQRNALTFMGANSWGSGYTWEAAWGRPLQNPADVHRPLAQLRLVLALSWQAISSPCAVMQCRMLIIAPCAVLCIQLQRHSLGVTSNNIGNFTIVEHAAAFMKSMTIQIDTQ